VTGLFAGFGDIGRLPGIWSPGTVWSARQKGHPVRATVYRRMAGITAAAAGCAVLALTALPAAAVARGPGAAAAETGVAAPPGGPADRYNTGATHSPQVLRELAGGAAGQGRGAPRSPIPGALQGVDVASFQHPNGAPIDWRKAAKAGIQFAAVKATEGDYYKNPYALRDLAHAKAAGLAVMAYAFAIPNGNGSSASPVVQANYLVKFLAKAGGTLPAIMLDIEYDPYVSTDHTNECYGLSKSAMVTWITRFDAEIRAKTGQDPIIYTPPPWWKTCTGGVASFREVPLWVPDPSSGSSPTLPAGWSHWAFWQYATGTVTGITGSTDLDQLNPGRISLLDPGLQRDVAGAPVDLQIAPADPVPGQTLSFSAPRLPPGLSISASGLITGTPSTAGTYHPTVRASDGQGQSGSVSFTWTVRAN
jgi:GH25 family lysozyme M1 (1,4-beta-N-acetylmuramidase)